jgi:hypothetical protein
MADVILITRADLVRYTAMNGNIDTDKFIQFVKFAQDVHIQNYTGTDLLNKIISDIEDDALAEPYLSLVNDYIKPMLIHFAMSEYLPWSAYTIANKGVYKHNSENAENVSKDEVDFLVQKSRSMANHYTSRFVDFMCYNNSTFPEYTSNTNNDISPDKDSYKTNWVL